MAEAVWFRHKETGEVLKIFSSFGILLREYRRSLDWEEVSQPGIYVNPGNVCNRFDSRHKTINSVVGEKDVGGIGKCSNIRNWSIW